MSAWALGNIESSSSVAALSAAARSDASADVRETAVWALGQVEDRSSAETLSQGQPNGYPAYRLEWEALGSLHRRLRACLYGLHAELPDYGSPLLLDLELFLAVRARGLPVETPAVRR